MIKRLSFLVLAGLLGGCPVAKAALLPRFVFRSTELITIHYVAHDGMLRSAYVLLPRWYDPTHDPPLPLVISPHGRGVNARANARLWGDLPGRDGFAVVNPEGQGRRLELYSWGDPGQIDDLARMPDFVEAALPRLRVDRKRIYAVGGSMGGQETLLLVARHPHLLAGAISFDAPTNLVQRFREFDRIPGGERLQSLARFEVGGTPASDPRAWAVRSPLDFARAIAASGVPLEIWWSSADRIVVDQAQQSGLLFREIKRIDPDASLEQFVGRWRHCHEMRWTSKLPEALALLGLG
jgi:pimeloyl-ACP methyl ester carboxylesterase